MDKISIAEGRKQLKALGYTLSARANPFKEELKTLSFEGNGAKRTTVTSAEVYSLKFRHDHSAAFNVINRIECDVTKPPNITAAKSLENYIRKLE